MCPVGCSERNNVLPTIRLCPVGCSERSDCIKGRFAAAAPSPLLPSLSHQLGQGRSRPRVQHYARVMPSGIELLLGGSGRLQMFLVIETEKVFGRLQARGSSSGSAACGHLSVLGSCEHRLSGCSLVPFSCCQNGDSALREYWL